MPRDRFATVQLRPFVVYRPPDPQVVRAGTPRAAYTQARAFIDRCARLVSAEGVIQLDVEREKPAKCDRCSDAEIGRIVSLATEIFGEPAISPERIRMEPAHRVYWSWAVASERTDDVLDFLEDRAAVLCEHVRVNAFASWMFFLRDLDSRRVLPYQQRKFRASWPVVSSLRLTLQSQSEARFFLVFPFEPDESLRTYVSALEAQAPVRFDPAYFDHFVPRESSRDFQRRRLPADWLISGDFSGTATQKQSAPPPALEPSDEGGPRGESGHAARPLGELVSRIGTALRTHRYRAVVVRGSSLIGLERLIERAAGPFGLRVVHIDCASIRANEAEKAIADAVNELAGERGVLVLAWLDRGEKGVRLAFEALMSTRSLGGITLPPEVRIAATKYVRSGPAERASRALRERARAEGFLPDESLNAADNDLYRRLCAEVSVSFIGRRPV